MQGFARDSPDGVTRDCTTDFTRDFVGEQETEVEDSQQVFTKPKLWWSSASVFFIYLFEGQLQYILAQGQL